MDLEEESQVRGLRRIDPGQNQQGSQGERRIEGVKMYWMGTGEGVMRYETHLRNPVRHVALVRYSIDDRSSRGHEDELPAFGDEGDGGLEEVERAEDLYGISAAPDRSGS